MHVLNRSTRLLLSPHVCPALHSCFLQSRADEGNTSDKHDMPDMSLFVRWYSPTGKTRVNHLLLKPIQGVQSLEVRVPYTGTPIRIFAIY